MNIYKELNKIIEYTENHLTEKIDTKEIAKMIGLNEYTFQRVFPVICDVSFTEYIRNRRLSNAGEELFLEKKKIVDLAIKYQYNNATAFSRAFERFHGIKPSEVKEKPEKLKMYTKLHFEESKEINKNMEYQIIERDQMILYGEYIKTENEKIGKMAPVFYHKCAEKYGEAPYAMTEYYDKERTKVKAYWVLYDKKIGEMEKIVIPKNKWIQFRVNIQEAKEIQKMINEFYQYFLPSCQYNFKDLPEIEYYHDQITDFLVPIES